MFLWIFAVSLHRLFFSNFVHFSLSPICLVFHVFSLLFWLVLCYFCIVFLSSNFFEANHFLCYVFFASINYFIWSSHILSIFFCFISLFFIHFRILLIFVCFFKFCISSQRLFRVCWYCLNQVLLFLCTATLGCRHLKVLFLKFLLALLKHFFFSHRGGKYTFARNK